MRANVAIAVISAHPAGSLGRPGVALDPLARRGIRRESGSSTCRLLFRLGLLAVRPRGDAATSGHIYL
jgi:hypothetical protein